MDESEFDYEQLCTDLADIDGLLDRLEKRPDRVNAQLAREALFEIRRRILATLAAAGPSGDS